MAEPAAQNMIGQLVLGRYRILRHLADGGMGAIYLARSEGAAGFMRPVVVKCLLPNRIGNDYVLQLFMREARIMSTLRHPGIVSVIDFAEEQDTHVMIMEYVHGFHLGRWQKFMSKTGRPFPVELAIQIVVDVLSALDYAHNLKRPDGTALNIVHRDVTPSNVLIDVEGRVKLADFGIARIDTEKTAPEDRTIKGKFPYLAPEMLEGDQPSPASDVYSAALVLHELIVGKNEFRAKEVPQIIARVLKHEPSAIDALRDVPPGLADVVKKGLAKKRADRYQSAEEFSQALQDVRTQTARDGLKQLAKIAEADFRNPRMAEILALPQLNTLESSWTTPSGVHSLPDPSVGIAEKVDLQSDKIVHYSGDHTGSDLKTTAGTEPREYLDTDVEDYEVYDGATSAQTPAAIASTTSTQDTSQVDAAVAATRDADTPKRFPWVAVILGVAVVGVGAVAVMALLQSQTKAPVEKQKDPAYILVSERGKAPVDAAAAARGASADAGVKKLAVDAQVKRRVIKRPTAPKTSGARLTRAFGRQKSKITACFRKHTLDLQGAPEISIRFSVALNGSITSATLSPTVLQTTAVGRCLLRVARSTRFGRQSRAVSFRVPLKARIRNR